MCKKAFIILLAVSLLAVPISCKFSTELENKLNEFAEVSKKLNDHGHAFSKNRSISLGFRAFLVFVMFWAGMYPGESNVDMIEPGPFIQAPGHINKTGPAIKRFKPAVANKHYDSIIDGAYLGIINFIPQEEDGFYYGSDHSFFPCLISLNYSSNNRLYASITVPDIVQTFIKEKHVWQTIYTDKIKVKEVHSNLKNLIITFDPEIVGKIMPLSAKGQKFKMTFEIGIWLNNGYLSPDKNQFGSGLSRGLYASFEMYRFVQEKKHQGIWISGYRDVLRANNQDYGEFFFPMTVSIVNADPAMKAEPNYYYVMFDHDNLSYLNVQGNTVVLSVGPDGSGFDFEMQLVNPGKMEGKFGYSEGSHSSWRDFNYSFDRVGYGGPGMRVKRLKPKAVQLKNTKKDVKLTLKGKNLSNGVMVHFSNKNLEVRSIEYKNHRVINLTVRPIKPIPKGTKMSVLAVNPDNSKAEKANVLTAK